MNRRKFVRALGAGAALLTVSNSVLGKVSDIATSESHYRRNPQIKPIMGSWFEFKHHLDFEGVYWNDTLAQFTEEQWKMLIKDISETGMQYMVLMSVADNGKTFYPSSIQPRYDFVCADPLEAVLSAADEYGLKFFISNDYWSDFRDVNNMMTNKEIAILRERGMVEVAEKYAHHKSFYGWYYPNETGIFNTIDDTTINYVNHCSQIARQLTPQAKTLIAPYGTKSIRYNDEYIRRLELLDIDIMAYQDEVGVKKTKAGVAGKYFEELYYMHNKAGRARLWADLEVFEFEDDVYDSALLPASFDRVLTQMEDISPFVENILIYQYVGLMSKPGSIAKAGHDRSEKLYSDYIQWYKKQRGGIL